jgi:hypothetical protein
MESGSDSVRPREDIRWVVDKLLKDGIVGAKN